MSYVITFTGRRGSTRTMRLDLGSEKTARAFCTDFAKRMRTVVLHEEDNGVSTAIARWESGHSKRNFEPATRPRLRTVVIEGELDDEQPNVISLDEQLDDGGEEVIADEHDDEAHHFEGQCMKCRVKREFVGRVKELSNGSRQAQGTCPVCGTTIVRMVSRTTPLDDWDDGTPPVTESDIDDLTVSDSDTPPHPADDDPNPDLPRAERPEGEDENILADSQAAQEYLDAETPESSDHVLIRENRGRNTTFTCSAGDWQMKTRSKGAETQAIAEFEAHRAEADEQDQAEVANEIQTEISEAVAEAVPEGTPVEDVAAATATLAMEFSAAADDTEVAKPAPRKRGSKKAKDTVDADAAAVANLETAKCPQCQQMIPVKVSGDGSLRYLMIHPDGKGNPECRGSRTTLD